jgi:hypothetical protein
LHIDNKSARRHHTHYHHFRGTRKNNSFLRGNPKRNLYDHLKYIILDNDYLTTSKCFDRLNIFQLPNVVFQHYKPISHSNRAIKTNTSNPLKYSHIKTRPNERWTLKKKKKKMGTRFPCIGRFGHRPTCQRPIFLHRTTRTPWRRGGQRSWRERFWRTRRASGESTRSWVPRVDSSSSLEMTVEWNWEGLRRSKRIGGFADSDPDCTDTDYTVQ